MLFNKVSGGAEKVTIDGKPAREKLNLRKINSVVWGKEALFPSQLKGHGGTIQTFEIDNKDYLLFDGSRYVFKGNIQKGWTEIASRVSSERSTQGTFIKNNELYYVNDRRMLEKLNINTRERTETNISIPVENQVNYMIDLNDKIVASVNVNASTFMYDINTLESTDLTEKFKYRTSNAERRLPIYAVFKKNDVYYLMSRTQVYDDIYFVLKTTDFNIIEQIQSNHSFRGNNGYFFEIDNEFYLATYDYNHYNRLYFSKFNINNYKFDSVGVLHDPENRFEYGPSYFYKDKTHSKEEYYLITNRCNKAVLLNDEYYREI